MKKFLYVTSDQIGIETGAGAVTQNELDSLKRIGPTDILNPPAQQDPFESDEIALNQCGNGYKLAHFYAGTYSKLISFLKGKGTKITYTAAAHDVEISKEDHEKFGQSFDYPHLTDPELFERYLEGYKNADVIICPSTHSKKVMESYGCKKVKVIPHGCYVSPAIEPLPKAFKVGYLGAVGFDKGLVYLLQAWAKLNYKNTFLTLAGKYTPTIMHLVRQYGGGSVYLAGWVKSPSDLYNSCSVYVQPSVSEGFGCEVIEAMAHGRPVICSDGAGAADCITHEKDGLIVPKRNSKALADAINFYKTNPDKIYEHGKNAREKAKQYSWDLIRDKYCKLWKEML